MTTYVLDTSPKKENIGGIDIILNRLHLTPDKYNCHFVTILSLAILLIGVAK
jgi:hypothetical protein